MTSTEKLVQELIKAAAPEYLIDRAKRELYNDFKSPSATPIMDLVHDLDKAGLRELSIRAQNGEFDGTKEESEEWSKTEEGQAATGVMAELRKSKARRAQ